MAGSLFSSINSTSQIDKQLNNSALFKDSKNANLQDSNLDKIEGDIKRAQQGRKALSFLGASSAAGASQGTNNTAPATSILSASSGGGLFGSSTGGGTTNIFGSGNSGSAGGNLFSTLA